MAESPAPHSMNQLSEQAGPADMPSGQQPQVMIKAKNSTIVTGSQNFVKNNDGSSWTQVNSDSGSDSSRCSSPHGPRRYECNYVTSKTKALIALCSPKAPIPVCFLRTVVDFADKKVPSSLDSYRFQIKDSFDLNFDPFEPGHQSKCFKLPKKFNHAFRDSFDHKVDAILHLMEIYNKVFCVEDDDEWHLQQQLLPHLDRWFSHVEENRLEVSYKAEFLTMCLHAFGKFRWTGWEDRLKNLCEKCEELCKDAPDDVRERTLREIGETYRKLCNYTEAENYLRKALNIHKDTCPVSLPYQISCMFLARCKSDMGEYQAAYELMTSCLDSEAVRNLKQKRAYLRCRMYYEMARSCEKLGKFGEACHHCNKALEDDKREDGFRYPQYLMYGALYRAMSTDSTAVYNEALLDCDKADSILGERHGKDHHHMAHVLCIQARIWLLKNEPKMALRLTKIACHITKKRYGYEHIKAAKMLDLLGDIHQALDNHEKAWKAYWMAKNMYSEKQHGRAVDIEQKLANMSMSTSKEIPNYTKSELFEELLV